MDSSPPPDRWMRAGGSGAACLCLCLWGC